MKKSNFVVVCILFFILITFLFYFHISQHSLAFKYHNIKTSKLFKEFPESTVFVGGDSAAEEGLDPKFIDPKAINISFPFGDLYALEKALKIFYKKPLSSENTIVFSTYYAVYSKSLLSSDFFVNHADAILEMPVRDLYAIWGFKFPIYLLQIGYCYYFKCRSSDTYRLDPIYSHYITQNKGIASVNRNLRDRVEYFTGPQEKQLEMPRYYLEKSFELEKSFKRSLNRLAATNAKIIIVFMPYSSILKDSIKKIASHNELIGPIVAECQKYKNCAVIDYIDFDNSKLGPENELEYFSDLSHLNTKGSKRLGLFIKTDIENVLSKMNSLK